MDCLVDGQRFHIAVAQDEGQFAAFERKRVPTEKVEAPALQGPYGGAVFQSDFFQVCGCGDQFLGNVMTRGGGFEQYAKEFDCRGDIGRRPTGFTQGRKRLRIADETFFDHQDNLTTLMRPG